MQRLVAIKVVVALELSSILPVRGGYARRSAIVGQRSLQRPNDRTRKVDVSELQTQDGGPSRSDTANPAEPSSPSIAVALLLLLTWAFLFVFCDTTNEEAPGPILIVSQTKVSPNR